MKKFIFLLMSTFVLFTGSVTALEVDISNQTVQDDWTEEEKVDNPIVFDLNISEEDSFSNFIISEDSFTIFSDYDNESEIVEVVPDVEEGTETGTYSEDYTIETEQDEISGTVGISVDERENNSIEFNLNDQQVDLDSSGTFGTITVENEGNYDVEIDYETDEDIIVNNEGSFIVEYGDEVSRDLFYRTDLDEELGEREFIIDIDGEELTKNYTIEDNIEPEIINIDFNETIQAKEATRLDVEATDNTGISSIIAKIIGEQESEEENGTEEVTFEEQELVEIDEDLFSADLDLTNSTGENRLEITVEDISGNTVTESMDVFVEELDVLKSEPSVDGGVAQTDQDSIVSAFTLEEDVETNVTLDSYSYDRGVGDSRVRLVLPDGSEEEFDSQGDSITVDEAGEYMFRMNGNIDSDYSARLSFESVDHHVDIDDVVIEGDFVDLVIPEDSSRDWPGADHLECQVENLDRNNLNESRYSCEIPFKMTELTSSDERLVPIAPSQQDKIENNLEDEIASLESDLRSTSLKYYGLGGASIFMFLFFIAYIKIVPRYMFMLR